MGGHGSRKENDVEMGSFRASMVLFPPPFHKVKDVLFSIQKHSQLPGLLLIHCDTAGFGLHLAVGSPPSKRARCIEPRGGRNFPRATRMCWQMGQQTRGTNAPCGSVRGSKFAQELLPIWNARQTNKHQHIYIYIYTKTIVLTLPNPWQLALGHRGFLSSR